MEAKTPDPRDALRQKLADMRSARTGGPKTRKALSKEIKSAKKSAQEAGRHAERALTDPHTRFAEQVMQNAFTGESSGPVMDKLMENSDESSGSDSDADAPPAKMLSQMEPLTGSSSSDDSSESDEDDVN